MFTHDEVNAMNRKMKKQLGDEAPRFIKATKIEDASIVAIHLLNPLHVDLEDALDVAMRDNFKCIVIHTAKTFGKVA